MKLTRCGEFTLIPVENITMIYPNYDGTRVYVHFNDDSRTYSYDLSTGKEIMRVWEQSNTSLSKKLRLWINEYLNSIRAIPVKID